MEPPVDKMPAETRPGTENTYINTEKTELREKKNSQTAVKKPKRAGILLTGIRAHT